MSTINPNQNTVAGNAGSALAGLPSSNLSQSDFLKLMTAQLKAQDPTKPVDNAQFVSQMAQFSQLSATQGLQTSLTQLSGSLSDAVQTSQVLSATNLVDRNVLVPSSSIHYAGSAITGAANLSAGGPVTVGIVDAQGQLVRSISLGTQPAGLAQFAWDGKNDAGESVPAGSYGMVAMSGASALDTYVAGKVSAVGYGGKGLGTMLQVVGVGGVPLNQVAQIL